jgi:hypothetical protein
MMRACPVMLLASWMAVTLSVAAQQELGPPRMPGEETEDRNLPPTPAGNCGARNADARGLHPI